MDNAMRRITSGPIVAATMLAIATVIGCGAMERAQAQTVTLVSNLEQSDAPPISIGSATPGLLAQSFRTGSHPLGYTLESVKVRFALVAATAGSVTVDIYSASGGNPNSLEHAMTAPASLEGQNFTATFTASPGATLSPDTTYFVYPKHAGGLFLVNLGATNSTSEDSTSATGWSIGNNHRSDRGTNQGWGNQSGVFKIEVNGAPRKSTARVTNVDVTSTPVYAYDTYGARETIQFTVTFDRAVTVTGRPHFEFNLGGTTAEAGLVSGSGTTTLVFGYRVQMGNSDPDGISIGDQSTTIKLGSGEYIRAMGTTVDAVLTHSSLGTLRGHKVDGAMPTPGFAPGAILTATLNVHDAFGGGGQLLGCSNTVSSARCSSGSVLGDDDFVYQGTRYFIHTLYIRPFRTTPTLVLNQVPALSGTADKLTLRIDGTDFAFEDADDQQASQRVWNHPGLDWTLGDMVQIAIFPPHDDARLSALSLGTGVELTPAFSLGTTEYRAWVANSVSSVPVSVTTSDDEATVEIEGDTDTATPETATLSLDPGANTVTVTVTAQDGSTRDYTVTVVREAAAPTQDADALLTANVTVGDELGLLGYYNLNVGGDSAITDSDFTVGDDTYDIGAILVMGAMKILQYNANKVIACFGGRQPSDAVRNALHLRIGTHSFAFASATAVTSFDCYEWERPTALSWEYGDIALVKIESGPRLTKVEVEGDAIAITYDQTLDTGSVPPRSAFTVKVTPSGGTEETRAVASTENAVGVSGTQVRLALESPVLMSDTVKLGYTVPTGAGEEPIQDSGGRDAAGFSDYPATNVSASEDASLSAFSLGAGVTLEPAFASGTTEYKAWVANSVSSVPVTATPTDTGEDGASVAIMPGASVALSPGLTTVTVTVTAANEITIRPYTVRIVRAAAAPTEDTNAVLTANVTAGEGSGVGEGLTGYSGIATLGTFGAMTGTTFTSDGETRTVTFVGIGDADAANVPIRNRARICVNTLEEAEEEKLIWRVGGMTYELSELDELGNCYDLDRPSGLDWDFGDIALIKIEKIPELTTATIDATSLVLSYDKDLDTNSTPDAGRFAVTVTPQGGTASTVALASTDPVTVSGKTVTLALAAAVRKTDTATVNYTVPTSATAPRIQDTTGHDAQSFGDTTVMNNTAAAEDATLGALALTGVTLDPTFDAATTEYRAWVDYDVASVTVTATPADAFATVAIAGDTDPSTLTTATQNVQAGRNTVTVMVTAEDESTPKTYTVTVVREADAPVQDPNAVHTANLTVGETGDIVGYKLKGRPRIGELRLRDFAIRGTRALHGVFLGGADAAPSIFQNNLVVCFKASVSTKRFVDIEVGGRRFELYEGTDITEPEIYEQCTTLPRPAGLSWEWGDIVVVKVYAASRAPEPPTELTATATGGTRIDLAWTEPTEIGTSGINGYKIEWSADGETDWQVLVEDTDSTDVTHPDTDLASETTRHYRVSAINDDGTGDPSESEHATTDDILGPELASASVPTTGDSVVLTFDEALEESDTAPASAFEASAGETALEVSGVATSGTNVTLTFAIGTPTVKANQTVVVTYTDPNATDDTNAVQDDDGNDAETFTTADADVASVTNGSTVPAVAPGVPTALATRGEGGNSIILTWTKPAYDGGATITGYRIEVSEDEGVTWTDLVANHNTMIDGKIATRHPHASLGNGDVRHYRVSAINSAGTGTATALVRGITVPPGAPDAPTGVTATADGGTAIDLAWAVPADTGHSAIRSYTIEWSPDGMTDWQLLRSTGPAVRAHPDTELSSETTRHYRIFAVNDEGSSAGSEVVSATTDDILGPEPQSATVAAAGTSIAIVFDEALEETAANLPPAARFEVTSADGTAFPIGAVSADGITMTLTPATGVPTIKTGQVITIAYTDSSANDDGQAVQDDDGNDAESFTLGPDETVMVTNSSTEAVVAPDAPSGLTATGEGGDSIVLAWTKPAYNGGSVITGYRIEVSDDDRATFAALVENHNTEVDGAIVTGHTHEDLASGDTRHYRVYATNATATSTASNVAEGVTIPPGSPEAPTPLLATAGLPAPPDGTTLITLAWTTPANEGDSQITGYRIEWSADGNAPWAALVADTGSRATTHIDRGLASETTRHYRVFATNDQGTGLVSNVASTTTADIVAPVPQSAGVAAAGTAIAIVFDEALADASASLPAPGAFTVRTGDGVRIAIDSVSVTDTVMTLSAASTSPTIKTGQTVTVTYTDPSAADDAAAIQDEADNDAASFTLGPGRTVTVTNGSTVAPTVPGAPTDLAVQGVGGDRIALTWAKPRDTGGRAISSYFIEVSEDGGTVFSELVPDHNTMVGGEIALRYLHTGLEATDVRHYRVSAKNSVGTGTASITAMGQPVEPIGRVDIAFDTPAATEGIALGWTVTATTLADEQPQSDFALRVAVASEADTAGDADYTRVAETVSFARSDFARRSVGGQMRWVAEKTGQVTTNDDVEVEATETFALTATVTNIVQSRFLSGTGRAEGSIEDNDTWTIEVIADPTSVAEGESRDVKLTARIAPASTECVVPFPVTVSLSATGTATSGTDYRLNGETNDQEIAPCTAETSWPVTMTSNVDTADDDGETVVFTPEIAGTPAIAPQPFQPATVTLRETRGVLLSALSLNAEEGRSTTYTMVLTSRPTGTVTVRPEVSGDMDVTVSPASLAFTPGDWNVRQTVKVHAAPDADEDDDAAEVSHQVSGADYGANQVSAGSIAISVQDDDATFGELTVGVLVGDAHNASAAAAPRVHFGEPFTITLWWSEIRTREWEEPQLAIGADRAIRVTGADVTPVKDDATDTWSRTSLRLKFTPHGTDDVTLVIEPLDCTRDEHGRYNRHAICAWVGSDRGGNTGLKERVRWTARGIAGAPAAPANVTVSPGHRVHREQYRVAFDAEPAATRYRVQIQNAGGSWSSPRTLTDDASGRREEVAIEGVSHAQDYDVRVRWENRFGESPWVTVHTSDTLAPPQPTGLTLTQDDDGHSVSLAWTPDTGGTTARYQYRVADEWTDIAQSGPGEANRRAYTVGGLSHTWKMEAQVRGVGPTGRTSEPSETAKVAYTPPHAMETRIRMASSPGSDGHYGVGDRMLVAVPMNRPVRRSGPLPTLDLQIGSTTHALALSRREPSQLASGVVEVPETAVTLYFAHTVTKHDEDTDGVSIPANGLSLNAGQLLDATEDGNSRRATFTLSQPKHFAAHKVQGVHAEVERIEWLENRVWVHYNRDLAPAGWESTGAYIERQFNPTYSVSRPLDRPVLDARIVRGRGWGTPCRHAERGCRTVQLTLRGVVRGNPVISSRATHDAPAPDEQAWMSYAPDPHLEQFRLRDAVGNQVPAFTRIEARHLAAGTDSVLSVASAAGREGRDEAIRFTVRMVPAATSRGHRRLRDPRGDRDGQRRLHPRLRHARLRARADGEDHRRAHRERHGEGQRRDLHADARQPVGRASRRRRGAGDDLERRNPERNVRRTPRQPRRHHRVHVQPRVQRRDRGEREHTQGQRAQRRRRHRHRSRADGRGEHPALERDGRALGRRRRDHRHRGDAELRGDRSDLHLRRSRARGADASHRALHDRHRRDRRRPAGRQDARSEPLARTRRHRDLAVAARRRGDRRGGRVRLHAGGGGRGRAACGAGRARRRGGDQRGDGAGVAGAGQPAAWRRRGGAAVGGADARGLARVHAAGRGLRPGAGLPVRGDGRDRVRGRRNAPCGVGVRGQRVRNVRAGDGCGGAPGGGAGGVLERTPDCRARGADGGRRGGALGSDAAAARGVSALHGRLVGRGPGGGVAAPDAGGGPGDRRGGDLGPRRQRDLGRGRACRGGSAVQRAGDGDGAGGRGADARHRARRHAARGGVYRRHGHGHALVPLHDRRGGRGGRGREAGPDRGGRALAQRRGDRGRRGTRGRARLLRRPLGGGGGG